MTAFDYMKDCDPVLLADGETKKVEDYIYKGDCFYWYMDETSGLNGPYNCLDDARMALQRHVFIELDNGPFNKRLSQRQVARYSTMFNEVAQRHGWRNLHDYKSPYRERLLGLMIDCYFGLLEEGKIDNES